MYILVNSLSSKSHNNVREADLGRLIELVELRQPLWNHRLALRERLPKIKTMLWNEVYVEFQGILMHFPLFNHIL